MRLVVAASNYDEAVLFYRDVLGGREEMQVHSQQGHHVTILDMGRATLEIANPLQVDLIDDLEVGEHVSPHLRVAFEVDDAENVIASMLGAGANLLAQPALTPWSSLNARLETPGDLQITVFEELHEPTGVAVVRDHGPSSQWEAARIWAAATAHRDNDAEPAAVQATLPIIESGLRPAGATLHMAYLRNEAAGFAVVVPRPAGLEIQYLGVDPTAWGSGIAGRLLSDVATYAQEQSQPEVELWVYDDNARAVDVYRRAGWSGTADVRIHATSGRLERRHVRRIVEAGCADVHP